MLDQRTPSAIDELFKLCWMQYSAFMYSSLDVEKTSRLYHQFLLKIYLAWADFVLNVGSTVIRDERPASFKKLLLSVEPCLESIF
jgi:hypothetical protein